MSSEEIESLVSLVLENIQYCTKEQIDRLSFATWMENMERGDEEE